MKRPLDVLLDRRRFTFAHAIGSLLGLVWLWFITQTMLSVRHATAGTDLLTIEIMTGVTLGCWASWGGHVFDNVRRSRFLELVLTTCMTPEEWTDGVLMNVGHILLRLGLPLWVLFVALGAVINPQHLEQSLLWFPAVIGFTMGLSYAQQLRGTMECDPLQMTHSWRGFEQIVLMLPIYTSVGLLGAWAGLDGSGAVLALLVAGLALWGSRRLMLRRLARMLQAGSAPVLAGAPRMAAWGTNPIVQRESCRAARGTGGLWLVQFQRWWPMLACAVVLPWIRLRPAQEEPAFVVILLVCVTVVLAMVTYWGMVARGNLEWRPEKATMMQSSALTTAELADGWASWLSRYPSIGLGATYMLAAAVINHSPHWSTGVLAIGVIAILSLRAGAYLGLMLATWCRSFRGSALYMLLGLSMYPWMLLFVAPFLIALLPLQTAGYHDAPAFVAAGVLCSALVLLVSRSLCLLALGGTVDGNTAVRPTA